MATPILLLDIPPSPTKPAATPSPLPLLLAAQPTPRLLQPPAPEPEEEEQEADTRRLLGSKPTAPSLADLYLAGLAAGFTDTHDLTDAMIRAPKLRDARERSEHLWCSSPWESTDTSKR
jgi:hypothetical protein